MSYENGEGFTLKKLLQTNKELLLVVVVVDALCLSVCLEVNLAIALEVFGWL